MKPEVQKPNPLHDVIFLSVVLMLISAVTVIAVVLLSPVPRYEPSVRVSVPVPRGEPDAEVAPNFLESLHPSAAAFQVFGKLVIHGRCATITFDPDGNTRLENQVRFDYSHAQGCE
jgi:hypothetical protein